MTNLFYGLEDYFDAVAERRRASLVGILALKLRGVCAFVGDVLRGVGSSRAGL